MRHLVFSGPGSLQWQECPDPQLSGPRDALVRPLAVARCDLDPVIALGLYPITQPMRDAVGEALTPYLSGKATARFSLDVPLPVELVRQLAVARVAEIAAIMATRPSKKPLKSRRPMMR